MTYEEDYIQTSIAFPIELSKIIDDIIKEYLAFLATYNTTKEFRIWDCTKHSYKHYEKEYIAFYIVLVTKDQKYISTDFNKLKQLDTKINTKYLKTKWLVPTFN